MSVFHLNSNYSKWRTAGVIIAALNIMFNIYFGQYFELLLYIVHLPSGYYAVLVLNLLSTISWLFGILVENTTFMLIALIWWTLALSPFVWIAIFDAIYDRENYAVRVNSFYAMTVFIVACYAIAVMCYRSMKSAEQNKSSPEASEISETPELDISSLPDETIETNRMAYV